jgi:hypothetical protein
MYRETKASKQGRKQTKLVYVGLGFIICILELFLMWILPRPLGVILFCGTVWIFVGGILVQWQANKDFPEFSCLADPTSLHSD